MTERSDTALVVCEAKDFSFAIVLIIVVLILHIPLMKVLVVNLRLELPRHKLVAGLSMSDCLLTTIMSIVIVATSQLISTEDSEACLIVRRIGHFSIVATTVINSLTISALCLERYVACIHSFHLDEIFTSRRVSFGLVFAWLCGGALGVGNAIFDSFSRDFNGATGRNLMVQIIVPLFVIPSSLIIVVVQTTLYRFSRKKLTQVVSIESSSNAAEAAELRRKQLKIAAVAGLTALLYLICFMPVCILMLFEMNGMLLNYGLTKKIIFGLRFINSIIDPFLYGLCIVDTREALLKDARRVKASILAVVTPSLQNP